MMHWFSVLITGWRILWRFFGSLLALGYRLRRLCIECHMVEPVLEIDI